MLKVFSFQTSEYGANEMWPLRENTQFFNSRNEAIEAYRQSDEEHAYVGSLILTDTEDVIAVINAFSEGVDFHYDNNLAHKWTTIKARGRKRD
tara:strand:+ start:164 stop:442 length:279 start_codon:yes stop_codon:yes gene_type:complete